MKVVLIRPPRRGFGDASLPVPPLGLAYVAASLRGAGHGVRILDGQVGQGFQDLSATLGSARPDVVGIGVLGPVLDLAARVARLARPHCRWILAGGPHPTSCGEAIFQDLPGVDLAISGEGEQSTVAALEWLAGGATGDPPPGVRAPGRRFTPRPPIADLAALARPAWDLLPMGRYRHPLATHRRMATLVSSRGCPHGCTFCDHGVHGHTWRSRAAADVVDEILELRQRFGIRYIVFYDDAFLRDRERAMAIAGELERLGRPVAWRCEARVDEVDPALLAALSRGGCHMVAFGAESGHPPTLARLNKGFTVEQVVGAFRMAHEAGLSTLAYLILGAPGEGADEVRASIRFCRRIGAEYAQFSTLAVFPGGQAALNGSVDGRNLFDADLRRRVASDIPGPVLDALLREAWLGFYLRPGPILRLGRDLLRSGSLVHAGRLALAWTTR